MSFTRPTLQQIIDRIKGDFKTNLSLTTILRRSFLDAMSKAFGGASHTMHGYIADGVKQLFPDTADEEYLLRWATIYGVTRNEAEFAEINVEVTGTTGGTLLAGTLYKRSDGFQYEVKEEVVVPALNTANAILVATEAGTNGNIDDGSIVNLLSPQAGIETNAEVIETLVEGEEQETIEDLRTRLLERIQQPPAGGTIADYVAFAKTVTGVTRVWITLNLGQGVVGLTFVEDNESPIIPSPAKVQEVQDAVELLKPISADLIVFAPTAYPMDPVIKLKPNTVAVQNAVITELEDLIIREAQVREGVYDVANGLVYDGKIPLSKINEAISIADGEDDHVLVNITSDVQPPEGGIVTLGTPVFQTLS